MKFKIVTDGKGQYNIMAKNWWWWERRLPTYNSIAACEKAIFRVFGAIPTNIKVENLGDKQETNR